MSVRPLDPKVYELLREVAGQSQSTLFRVTPTQETRQPLESDVRVSAAQAGAVVQALQQAGLDPSRLVLRAHAGYAPDPGAPPQRVELVVHARAPREG